MGALEGSSSVETPSELRVAQRYTGAALALSGVPDPIMCGGENAALLGRRCSVCA